MEPAWLSEAEAVFDRISQAQEEAARDFSPDLSDVGDRPVSDGAVLAPGQIRIDRDRFQHLLARTLEIIQDWIGGSGVLGDAGDAGPQVSDAGLERLLAAAVEGEGALEKRAEEFGAQPEPFACAVRQAFAPFLKSYARGVRDKLGRSYDAESFFGGRCPVCGAEPFMAELDGEDGRRLLACGLCGTRWRFPRLECPFCGTRDHEKLGFLEVEGPRELTAGYRVDVCEVCRRYVKTVDRRVLERPPALELADVLTPELDEAALERGYGVREPAGDG